MRCLHYYQKKKDIMLEKMRVFILEKLSLVNLIIVIVLKFLGFKIYFYKLSKILQSKKIIRILKSLNIKWIDFNDRGEFCSSKIWLYTKFKCC